MVLPKNTFTPYFFFFFLSCKINEKKFPLVLPNKIQRKNSN